MLPSEVLFSHVVTQFIVLCGQVAITLVFILVVFGIPNLGPVGWLIGLALAQGTAGMTYGNNLLITSASNYLEILHDPARSQDRANAQVIFVSGILLSTVFNDVSAAMQASIGSFYPILLLSGTFLQNIKRLFRGH